MNTRKLVIAVAILTAFGTVGCATVEPISPKAALQIAPEKVTATIPGWYIDPPESTQDALYVVGTALSRDLAMSVQKAQLDAETHLASKIAGEVSSLTKDYKSEANDTFTQSTEIISNKIAAEVKVIGGVIDKKLVVAEGGGFRTYVMMRYPIGSNNRLNQLHEAAKKPPTQQEQAQEELDMQVAAKREPVAVVQPVAAPTVVATNNTVVNVANQKSTDPVVDTSNPYLTVTVTPAADASEEN